MRCLRLSEMTIAGSLARHPVVASLNGVVSKGAPWAAQIAKELHHRVVALPLFNSVCTASLGGLSAASRKQIARMAKTRLFMRNLLEGERLGWQLLLACGWCRRIHYSMRRKDQKADTIFKKKMPRWQRWCGSRWIGTRSGNDVPRPCSYGIGAAVFTSTRMGLGAR